MMATAPSSVTGSRGTSRSSALGVVALVLAAAGVAALPTLLALLLVHLPLPATSAGAIVLFAEVYGVGAFLMLAAVLGLLAVVLARGRWWGLAAILVAVVGSPWFSLALIQAFPPAGKG
jgi:hypothetical protein